MTKHLRRKKNLLLLAAIACLCLFGCFLFSMQTGLAVKNQVEHTRETVRQIPALVDNAYRSAEQNRLSYDEVYQSKAVTVAYMAARDSRFQSSTSYLQNLASKIQVDNIILLDRQGNVTASADSRTPDFTRSRYNQLRTVFETGEPAAAFDVTTGDVTRRYYASKLDDSHEVVIEQNSSELQQIQSAVNSWENMLGNVKAGLGGYTFAVSSQDYTILYHPDETMLGQDSLQAGLKVEHLEEGYYGWMNLNGQRLLCGVTHLDAHNAYVICAVPEGELTASRNITVGIVLFIFFVVLTLVSVYAILLLRQQETEEDQDNLRVSGRLRYNRELGKRLGIITVVGLIFLFTAAFYMQTLFSLSLRSISNTRQLEDVETTFARNEEEVQLLTSQYNKRYLNKCQIAADILSANPRLLTKRDLAELSQVLDIEYILLFDRNGRETVSDSSYVNFQVSDNPQDQSYVFGRLLQGVPYVIQEPMPDELSGVYHQYIGSLMYDMDGNADGFVQISIRPEKLEEALSATGLHAVLDKVKTNAGGFALAVDKETETFSWYPSEKMIGRDAIAYGFQPSQFRDGYSGYLKVDSEPYYGSCLETGTDYIYVVTPKDNMNDARMPVALASTGAGGVLLLLLFALLTLDFEKKQPVPEEETAASHERMIPVRMPDDRMSRTESAASRWANSSIKWDEKTPEQQMISLLKMMMAVLAAAICLMILMKDRFLGNDSIFLYIIDGNWERGINVFAITGSLMIICVISVFVMIFRELLRILSRNLDARGETVCRMLRSFAKYISFIAMLYYCLALLGVDTKTLLASAGILSLVIGLGAKTLVSDILAGLFIIFEGEFRVGDIVTIGDWRGTVQEIGVRTTKIMDAGQNVKIISNSDVSGVINMTRKNSYAMCDVGIEYGESLERVENLLAKELPKIKKRLPSIKEGPFYKGVVSLGDNSVNIRILAQCAEGDRAQLARDLNREMKLLFDKYDINIPFPQVVINQPKEYVKATEYEKKRADAFNESQKELSKEIQEEEQDRT